MEHGRTPTVGASKQVLMQYNVYGYHRVFAGNTGSRCCSNRFIPAYFCHLRSIFG